MSHVQSTRFQPLSTQRQGSDHASDRAVQRTLRDSVADALGVAGKSHGVHGLAIAIRDQLANASEGTDAVSQVQATIDSALDDAASQLAAQGFSQDEIDAGLDRFRGKLAREINELADSETSSDQAETSTSVEESAIAARQVVRERFSLDVVTAEGDTVSIKFKSLNVTEAAAATVPDGTNTATAVSGSVISRGRFSVEVDGDLSEEERTALGDLLDQVDDIATDFFEGDVRAAFSAAARVSVDSSALSAFDLKLSYSRSTTAVQAYANTARPGCEPATPADSSPSTTTEPAGSETTSASETRAATTSATTAVETGPTEAADADTTSTSTTEGTPTSTAAAESTAKTASAMQTITSFAKDVLERLDQDDESSAAKFSLRWKVEFMIKAFGSVALTPVEQKAVEALGIALDGQSST